MGDPNRHRFRHTHSFDYVLRREYASIWLRRPVELADEADRNAKSAERGTAVPPELFGVALSGGGIRSASYCLGALQALDQKGLAGRIDYLSTVSGGGYIGASMISAMTQNGEKFPFSSGPDSDTRDNEPVGHLRDNSRFLAPLGLYDLLISLTVVLRGLVVNLILILCLLLPLASLMILANPSREHLDRSVIYDTFSYWFSQAWRDGAVGRPVMSAVADPFVLTKIAALLLFGTALVWALHRSYLEVRSRRGHQSTEQDSLGARIGRWLIFILLGAAALELQPPVLAWVSENLGQGSRAPSILGGFWTLGVAIVTATAALRGQLLNWVQKALGSPSIAELAKAWFARSVIYLAGLILPLLIYGAFLTITSWGIRARICVSPLVEGEGPGPGCKVAGAILEHAPAALMLGNKMAAFALAGVCVLAALAALAQVALRMTRKGPRLQLFLRRIIRHRILVGLILLLVAFLVAAAIATRGESKAQETEWIVLAQYGLLLALVCLIGWQFTENANGLHRLYRDRLSAAFRLERARGVPLKLSELNDNAPYLLINGTLNARETDRKADANPTSKPDARVNPDPARRGRNAEFFLFSRFFVGSSASGYAGTKVMERLDPQLDLATAVAISAAAVSSSMGRIKLGLLAPTLALLNLRLGYWLTNPRFAWEEAARKAGAKDASASRKWYDILRFYLAQEALGLLRADSSRVYVTDGGHIDNIGLYQLLKRRCKYIIVIDSEADPGMTFGAFCDVQRFARIDEGVHISLQWLPIREASLARAADRSKRAAPDADVHDRHFAVGKILYEKKDGATGKGTTEEGLLVYVKASMTGDEADYVLDYERRNSAFPHKSTGDQFFSEEQMEAYRWLGYHCVSRMLSTAGDGTIAYPGRDDESRDPIASMVRKLKATASTVRP